MIQPLTMFFADDGVIPNSRLPLLLYRDALGLKDDAFRVQEIFGANNWTNSWVNGIYPFHHYHSTSHEVLGIFRGSATVCLGGEEGKNVNLEAGDLIVIPAGVGHKRLVSSADFGVVGAYPEGRQWDLLRGRAGERPRADQNIAAIPIPGTDPLYGFEGPLLGLWSKW